MSTRPLKAGLDIEAHPEDPQPREAPDRRLTASGVTGRLRLVSWLRALMEKMHDIACHPVLGGCAEELIDGRASRTATIAD